MACADRLLGGWRASAIRRPPHACAARRRADVHGMRRRADDLRDAGGCAVACGDARSGATADDASASEGGS
ncbi:hypothetical protein CFB44_28860 [Burkholderia sp. AU31280]|nr:hypothetical protein CFB44_28860 [Burkholderia sp. AU31280]RQV59117.1 hypothetical protein DF024_23975 [Burkholderia cenocepacia]